MTIITLISDFGLKDPYVAEMKAVILSICPNVTIIDVTHEVDKFDMNMGMFILASVAPYFPKGTIHIAVIDPEVGGARRSILVEGRRNYYIGPDNGVLIMAAKNEGIKHVYNITNKKSISRFVSSTFHGRDIFAYIASHIAKGFDPREVGNEIDDYVIHKFREARIKDKEANCEIIYADEFGNLITNIHSKDRSRLGLKLGRNIMLEVRENKFNTKLKRTYSEVAKKELLALIGSHNYLEIAVNQGSAKEMLKINKGDELKLILLD
ncbi:MAG: S-adenosyl-l-methionine hydroxide adenosyltransferase family protein [Candidatus Bathyarchaeota archaeon]|nr:S-adenosyl-l-methionine hydroxide adenosyltransferase family protein [Candidatus Bathyarchaeota archaeon]